MDIQHSKTVTHVQAWTSGSGEVTGIKQMSIDHLYNAFRMTWNHSVPKAFRLKPYNFYRYVEGWSAAYRRACLNSLGLELRCRRAELGIGQKIKLNLIRSHTRTILKHGL